MSENTKVLIVLIVAGVLFVVNAFFWWPLFDYCFNYWMENR